jgi:hypothetical protein
MLQTPLDTNRSVKRQRQLGWIDRTRTFRNDCQTGKTLLRPAQTPDPQVRPAQAETVQRTSAHPDAVDCSRFAPEEAVNACRISSVAELDRPSASRFSPSPRRRARPLPRAQLIAVKRRTAGRGPGRDQQIWAEDTHDPDGPSQYHMPPAREGSFRSATFELGAGSSTGATVPRCDAGGLSRRRPPGTGAGTPLSPPRPRSSRPSRHPPPACRAQPACRW